MKLMKTQIRVLAALIRRYKFGQKLVQAHDEYRKPLTDVERWRLKATQPVFKEYGAYVHDEMILDVSISTFETLYRYGFVDAKNGYWCITDNGQRALRKARFVVHQGGSQNV